MNIYGNRGWLQIGYKNPENMMTNKPENTPFVTQGFFELIREGGRTICSGNGCYNVMSVHYIKKS